MNQLKELAHAGLAKMIFGIDSLLFRCDFSVALIYTLTLFKYGNLTLTVVI